MNKRQIEKLYKGSDLADGFNTLLKEIANNYNSKKDKINKEEKLAYEALEEKFTKKRNDLEKKRTRHYKRIKRLFKNCRKIFDF